MFYRWLPGLRRVPKIRALCKKLKKKGGGRFYSRMEKEKIGFIRKICDLEACYVITRLNLHYRNFNKRLIKSLKLYFWDTGLASFLLNITSVDHLQNHPLKGSLFETFIVTELLKQKFSSIKTSNFYYWRDKQ